MGVENELERRMGKGSNFHLFHFHLNIMHSCNIMPIF